MNINEKYEDWLRTAVDKEVLEDLRNLEGNESELNNSFYKDLEFGTAGLRGIIGAGTNKMNIYTVGRSTKGICDYLKTIGGKRVAICYDSRIKSDLFAKMTASIFAYEGFEVFIVKDLMPTPFLAFITKEYSCDIGIMITASHNPREYNGYKVFWNDACQIRNNIADEMINHISQIDYFTVKSVNFEEGIKNGIIKYVDDLYIEKYLRTVESNAIQKVKEIKICYTALNGTGFKLVPEIFRKTGQRNIRYVDIQCKPDGNFTTCPYPNPEKKEALELGLEIAKEADSDLLIATDPDADRIGIAVKHKNEYSLLSGNEVGILLFDYMLSQKQKLGKLPENPVVIKTIVTSSLADLVAEKYGAEIINTYTGFKFMGEQVGILEKKGEINRFIMAFEESYGYLIGTHVRDKDAVVASMLVAEMTAYHLENGKTLIDRMKEIYNEFGLFEHNMLTYRFEGMEGNYKMKEIFVKLRNNLPNEILGIKISKTIDYLSQTEFNLPKDNILEFRLENGGKFIVRPSGTEPIVKIYITAAEDSEKNKKTFEIVKEYTDKLFI